MDDARGVDVGEALEKAARDAEHLVREKRTTERRRGERSPLDELGDEPHAMLVLAEVEDARDAPRCDRAHHGALVPEPLGGRVRAEPGRNPLERQVGARPAVARAKNRAESTGSERGAELVAASKHGAFHGRSVATRRKVHRALRSPRRDGARRDGRRRGKLDDLIVQKVRRELRALDADPMRIAGLNEDENAKPCDQRVVFKDGSSSYPGERPRSAKSLQICMVVRRAGSEPLALHRVMLSGASNGGRGSSRTSNHEPYDASPHEPETHQVRVRHRRRRVVDR